MSKNIEQLTMKTESLKRLLDGAEAQIYFRNPGRVFIGKTLEQIQDKETIHVIKLFQRRIPQAEGRLSESNTPQVRDIDPYEKRNGGQDA